LKIGPPHQPCSSQLPSSLQFTTCNRLDIIKPEQAMWMHPDIGLMIASCSKSADVLQLACFWLCIHCIIFSHEISSPVSKNFCKISFIRSSLISVNWLVLFNSFSSAAEITRAKPTWYFAGSYLRFSACYVDENNTIRFNEKFPIDTYNKMSTL
jgi:hypothetical protein